MSPLPRPPLPHEHDSPPSEPEAPDQSRRAKPKESGRVESPRQITQGQLEGNPALASTQDGTAARKQAVDTARGQAEAEAALKLIQERLEAAQAHALVGSWELGPNLVGRYWSKQMFTLFHFDPELGVPEVAEYLARVHPDDRASLLDAHRDAIERRKSHRMTYRGDVSLGSTRYFEVTIVPEFDEQGKLRRVAGTTQDVTERVLAELEVKRSQARLESAQIHARIGNFEYDPATRATFWSRQLYVLHHLAPESAVPAPEAMHELLHPEDREHVAAVIHEAIAGHVTRRVVYRSNPSRGPVSHFELNLAPLLDDRGQLRSLTGTIQDVTEREQTAEALRASEQGLQRLFENSNDLFGILDAEGNQRSLRGPFRSILGYDPAELEGTNALAQAHPDDVSGLRRALAVGMAHPGVPQRVEYRSRHKLGHWVELEVVGTSWFGDPFIHGIVFNIRQISERKRAEQERSKLQEQLQQAIKMEAVGRLAGGVAHDFNNLLTIILGNIDLALDTLKPEDPLALPLTDVNEAATSAASLTRQLLAFSRRQLVEPKVVDLNDLVGNLQKMLGRVIGEDIALELRLSADLGSVRIDPGQFDQVIVNLAVNARDAMPKGGRLTIETSNIELDEDYCRTHRDLTPGPFVALAVTDDGEGMTRETLSHIFEPFFTTKPPGAGTGLGLSVIFGVVKQAGGTIETYSELGHGTTFKIYLPRIDAPAQRLDQAKVTLEALRGTETILLVEDNDNVRELTTIMLGRLGYQILVAANGNQALALLEEKQPAIDLLLTDLVMPEMSGRELSDRVRALYPKIAVLYCSGYTEDTFVRHGLASENLHFIGKPFTLQQLGAKVRRVLDDHSRPALAT